MFTLDYEKKKISVALVYPEKLKLLSSEMAILEKFLCSNKTRKFEFRMKYFGDVGGILLYKDRSSTKNEVEVVPTTNGTICNNLDMPDEIETNAYLFKKDSDDESTNKEEEEQKKKREEKLKARKKYKLYMPDSKNLYPFIA